MDWIENFNSPNGVEDSAPVVWKKGDMIADTYIVENVRQDASGQTSTVYQRDWSNRLRVKSPRPKQFQTPEQQADFIREADVGLRLGLNTYIVSCYYVLRLGGLPHIFSEYLDDDSLQDWIRSGKLYGSYRGFSDDPLYWILRIAIRSAWGLHYAHLHGVVHQDVKPANIVMDDGFTKVKNFGRAADLTSTAPDPAQYHEVRNVSLKVERMTAVYCSPEQERGELVSHRTDIWSWAVMVFEMFVGSVTWSSGPLAAEALEDYLQTPPAHDSRPRIPEAVAEILRRCLQNDPASRPSSLLAVADEMEALLLKLCDDSFTRSFVTVHNPTACELNNRALSYFNLGRTEQAMALWEQALNFNRTHPDSVFNRGLLLWRAGKIDDENFLSQLEAVKEAHRGGEQWRWIQSHAHYLTSLARMEQGDWSAADRHLGDEDDYYSTDNRERRDRLETLWSHFHQHDKPDWSSPIRGRHESGLNSVCFTPDGKWALSAGNDNELQLWDVSYSRWLLKGEPIRTFYGHTDAIRSVCVSRDGGYVASGGRDETVKLWALYTGACLKTFSGHTGAVTSVCFDSQGAHLFSGGSYHDLTVRMWNISGGEVARTFVGHTGPVNALAISADDKYLATGGGYEDNGVRLWDVTTGNCLLTFTGHTDIVQCVSITADGKFILSGGSDRTVNLWDASTGECLRTLRGHPDTVFSVAQTSDGRYAVSGSRDGRMKLWDLSSGRCLRTFFEENHPIRSVAITNDGTFALSGADGGDCAIRLWRTNADFRWFAPLQPSRPRDSDLAIDAEERVEADLKAARAAIAARDFHTAERHVDSLGYEDGYETHPERLELLSELYQWCDKNYFLGVLLAQTFSEHALETETVGGVESVHVSRGYYWPKILSRGRMTLKYWDLKTGEVDYEYKHWTYLTAADLSPEGEFIVYADSSPKVEMRRLRDGMCMRGFYNLTTPVTALSFNFYRDRMLTNGKGNVFQIWNSHRAEILHECVGHTGSITSLCLNEDATLAVSASTDHTVRLWDVETGKCLRIIDEIQGVSTVTFSRNGTEILTGAHNGELSLWETATGQRLRLIAAHKGVVSQACLTADGKFGVSSGWDRQVKLWDLSNGFCLTTLNGGTDQTTSVGISEYGDYLVAGNQDGTVRVWQLLWTLRSRDT